ncbi:MAG: hypothetical protein MZU95_16230 [Desulfomicrobium escambiense]|nr:hypothetical protein [Desulfomicrobium escambiense]
MSRSGERAPSGRSGQTARRQARPGKTAVAAGRAAAGSEAGWSAARAAMIDTPVGPDWRLRTHDGAGRICIAPPRSRPRSASFQCRSRRRPARPVIAESGVCGRGDRDPDRACCRRTR